MSIADAARRFLPRPLTTPGLALIIYAAICFARSLAQIAAPAQGSQSEADAVIFAVAFRGPFQYFRDFIVYYLHADIGRKRYIATS